MGLFYIPSRHATKKWLALDQTVPAVLCEILGTWDEKGTTACWLGYDISKLQSDTEFWFCVQTAESRESAMHTPETCY